MSLEKTMEDLVSPIDWNKVVDVIHTTDFFFGCARRKVKVVTQYTDGKKEIQYYFLHLPDEMEVYYTKYPDKRPTK